MPAGHKLTSFGAAGRLAGSYSIARKQTGITMTLSAKEVQQKDPREAVWDVLEHATRPVSINTLSAVTRTPTDKVSGVLAEYASDGRIEETEEYHYQIAE